MMKTPRSPGRVRKDQSEERKRTVVVDGVLLGHDLGGELDGGEGAADIDVHHGVEELTGHEAALGVDLRRMR